ncbi:hypothetical protein KDA_22380 [Dictyobacter alpinus]|uniref:Uncharacterized protein n=1 Tax=Dictyobacter alpinus TaxID=2014873 RepID=A0A402B5Y1_9CHLR|nr:hypothetical protein [Dictyobacter alpinus]GCE26754.1 hypothetical protein KDA_22380 [Dictyobacter alpinus]
MAKGQSPPTHVREREWRGGRNRLAILSPSQTSERRRREVSASKIAHGANYPFGHNIFEKSNEEVRTITNSRTPKDPLSYPRGYYSWKRILVKISIFCDIGKFYYFVVRDSR